MDTKTVFFQPDPQATAFLQKKDKRLGNAIQRIGTIQRRGMPDSFLALVHSIIGQQISMKAQESIWQRVLQLFPQQCCTPQALLQLDSDTLRSAGLSSRKVSYIQGVAQAFASRYVTQEWLEQATDEEICQQLTLLPGVGRWTVEMLLIFSLQRPDVFSRKDLGLLRGLRMLYRHKEITATLFQRYRQRYSPYGTTASLYLWAVAGGAIPELCDPARKASG